DNHARRQPQAPVFPGRGEPGKRGPARITQAEQLRRLVECFAGCVVLCLSENLVVPDLGHPHQLRMSPRNEQRYEWKLRRTFGEQWRQEVALEVVDADRGGGGRL